MLFIPDPSAMLSVMDSESSLYYLIVGQSMFNYGVAYLLFGCFKHFTVFTQEEVLANFDIKTPGESLVLRSRWRHSGRAGRDQGKVSRGWRDERESRDPWRLTLVSCHKH